MTEDKKPKLKGLLENWVFWLIVITGIAIIIRSIPAWIYAVWGCDSGIYVGIADEVVRTGEFFPPYYGWGGAYNEFPILYAVVAIATWITGLDVIVIMPKLIPLIGAFTVFIFYFIVKELTENKKIAIISAFFLAVSAFHVYQLSHAAPLVMGHFFMMLSLYSFIKFRKNVKYIYPLILASLFLIMSHHFTTYIFLISLISIVFFENVYNKEWTNSIRKDVIFILLISGMTFSYWGLVATTVFDRFMRVGFTLGGIRLNSLILIATFYIIFLGSFLLIKYIRKQDLIKNVNPPSIKSSLIKFSLAFIVCLAMEITFLIVDIPQIYVKFTPLTLLYSIPLIIIFSLAVAGFRYTRIIKNGLFIRGWLIGILLSFIYSVFFNSSAILPERHPEYFSIPITIIAAIGFGTIFSDPEFKKLFSKLKNKQNLSVTYFSKKIKISHKKRIFATLCIFILVTTSGAFVYPSFLEFGPDEGINKEALNTIEWIAENLDINNTVIASDHRLERMIENLYNFSTTGKTGDDDKAVILWASENLTEYYDELNGTNRNYTRITHVLIDHNMKYHSVHVGRGFIDQYMTNETWTGGYDKFLQIPFNLVYRNESEARDQITNESLSWAEVFEVNWTYLDEKYENH